MKSFLTILFTAVFVSMSWITVAASLDQSVWQAARELWPDLWFRATLLDAYFGFLTFYIWVAYKESNWAARGIWLVCIMLLGNFAISAYVLWQLSKMKEFSWETLLLRSNEISLKSSQVD